MPRRPYQSSWRQAVMRLRTGLWRASTGPAAILPGPGRCRLLGPGRTLIGHAIRIGSVTIDAQWTFPRVGGKIEAGLKTPVLFNGPPWSRSKTRVRTSQVATMPPRGPRKAFWLSGRPSLGRRHQSRKIVGLDGNKG